MFNLIVNVCICSIAKIVNYKMYQNSCNSKFNLTRSYRDLQFEWHVYVRTLLSLLLFSYTSITSTIFSFLDCRDVGPFTYVTLFSLFLFFRPNVARRVITSAPEIECTTEEYKRWKILAIILLSMYLYYFLKGDSLFLHVLDM